MLNTTSMQLALNEDIMFKILLLVLKSTTDKINTEIKTYQQRLSLKDMHSAVKSYGFKFYERHQNFQDKMHRMIKSQKIQSACIQLVCTEFNKLTRVLSVDYVANETLIVSKCTLISQLYKNMVKNYFLTASQHLLHPVLHTT